MDEDRSGICLRDERYDTGQRVAQPNDTRLEGRPRPVAASTREQALRSIAEGADRFAVSMRPHLEAAAAAGARSFHDVARFLNRQGVASRRGGRWGAAQVRNVTLRLRNLDGSAPR
jgi:hypothetical protein